MPRKGENIYKRKDGRWEGRYIRDSSGQQRKFGYVYGKTYSEVKKLLLIRKSCVSAVPTPAVRRLDFYDQILDAWLTAVKLQVKESTFARYCQLAETHIRPYLGGLRLSQLTREQVQSLVQHLLTQGRRDGSGGLANKTVADILAIVKDTISYADSVGLEMNCDLTKLMIKSDRKPMRVLTPSEQEALTRTLICGMDRYRFGVLLSLYTGIRLGELCALQWRDFDFITSTLKVQKTMQRIRNDDRTDNRKTKIIITDPKSRCSQREIPLLPDLAALAKDFLTEPDDFVLSGDSASFVEPRTMQNRFHSYVRQSGIAAANFHSLRHTFATRCVEAGFEVKSLSEILGHSAVSITLDRYVHTSLALKRSNMQKLEFKL